MYKTVLSAGIRTWMVKYIERSIVENHMGLWEIYAFAFAVHKRLLQYIANYY